MTMHNSPQDRQEHLRLFACKILKSRTNISPWYPSYKLIAHKSNLATVRSLLNSLEDAIKTRKPVFYSDWIVDSPWICTDGTTFKISPPPWRGKEKVFVNTVFEFFSLLTFCKFGFMATVLIINKEGEWKGKPSPEFSRLARQLDEWTQNKNDARPISDAQHNKYIEEHTKWHHQYLGFNPTYPIDGEAK